MRQRTQTYPLRKVMGLIHHPDYPNDNISVELLTCGHWLYIGYDGPRMKRRCWKCAKGMPVEQEITHAE